MKLAKIVFIDTELGKKILDTLKMSGWRKVEEYDVLAFDKGVDFDSYSLRKGDLFLEFEWSNWFEWQVSGSESAINNLAEKYSLELRANG